MKKNAEDVAPLPKEGKKSHGMGLKEFKGQADPIAYGAAGKAGCASDEAKIKSQAKHYNWD